MGELVELLAPFRPTSLDELEAEAALQKRVDNKYLVTRERVAGLLERLRDDHRVLEIDGARAFRYDSVYYDTPELACFRDHVEGRRPRMKIRSRLYVDSGECSFEVKVATGEGETHKHHLAYDRADHGTITPRARAFVAETVREALGEDPPADLAPALVTRFRRATLTAAREGERLTCDVDLELARPDGDAVRLRGDHVVLESKTADGDGRPDRVLGEAGVEPVSLSKYRTGIALLVGGDTDVPAGAGADGLWERSAVGTHGS